MVYAGARVLVRFKGMGEPKSCSDATALLRILAKARAAMRPTTVFVVDILEGPVLWPAFKDVGNTLVRVSYQGDSTA